MLTDTDVEDHYNPSVRLLDIEKNGSHCGFHLTRGKWDPYPWVSGVDVETAAYSAGMKPGDCLLEVNGEDIVGQRISEIAEIVKSKPKQVSLLLWNAGVDPQCTPEALCCGPMPANLQKLSACMSTILAFLECPVCLDTIQPPTYQCDNGHLICIRCRTKSERCPVCRQRLNRGRSLLADQVYNALIDAFNLREESEETRSAKIQQIFKLKNKNKNIPDIKITQSHTNKFLARIIGKASSADNLSSTSNSKYLNPSNTSSSETDVNTKLKTKSLSTNEIFQTVSRTGSMNRLSRNDKNKSLNVNYENRPASYHGSFESLDRKIAEVTQIRNSNLKSDFAAEDGVLFHCPFVANCNELIHGNAMIDHFKTKHNGPLVQYFKTNIQISLQKIIGEEDVSYMIHSGDNAFFLKIFLNKQKELLEDILVWVWHMGSKKASKDFEIKVELKTEILEDVLLSVRSSVFSLSHVPWQEIKDCKKGVFLSAKTLDVLGFSSNILLDIQIVQTEND